MTSLRHFCAVLALVLAISLSGCMSLAELDGIEALQPGDISGRATNSSEESAATQEQTAQNSSDPEEGDTAPPSQLISSAPQQSGISALPPEWDSLPQVPVEPLSYLAFSPPLWQDVVAASGTNGTFVVVYENDARRATRDIDLDGEPDVEVTPASGPDGYIVASYDRTWSVVWARLIVVDALDELFVDPEYGDIYLVGTWNGTYDIDMDRDGQPELTAYRDEPDFDDRSEFVARLRSDGTAAWARRLSGFTPGDLRMSGDGVVQSIAWVPALPRYDYERGAADVDGDGEVDFERGQFLLSIGRDGNLSVADEYSWLSSGWIAGSVFDPDGSTILAGTLRAPADLDQDGVHDIQGPEPDAGRSDVFVARFDSNGSLLWANSYASSPRTGVGSVVGAPDGSLYLAGSYAGQGNSGPDLNRDGVSDFPPAGQYGVVSFMARFLADGTFDWSLPMGAPSLIVVPDGGLLVAAAPPSDVPARASTERPAFDDPHIFVEGRGRVDTPVTGIVTSISPSGTVRWVGTVSGDHVRSQALIPTGELLSVVGTYGIAADLDNDGEFESFPDGPMGGADFKSGPFTPFILSIEAP